jgi:hypothetical protein
MRSKGGVSNGVFHRSSKGFIMTALFEIED